MSAHSMSAQPMRPQPRVTAPQSPTSPDPVLEAAGLHRFYRRGGDEVAALLDVSFTVAAGETLAVVGPSGSGKSTLLNLLAGLDDPDGGSVWVDGQQISHATSAAQAGCRARSIGVLTQSSGLVDHLDVLGNLVLAASFRDHRARAEDVRPLLDAVLLPHRAHSRPSTLSGGETARANLAVALAGDPLVLLADEPTAEVSTEEEVALLDLFHTLRPAHGATVLVTHSAVVAASADRTLYLVDGRTE